MAPELTEEALELLCSLLAEHYINGGLPATLMAEVEAVLQSAKRWFPDPQATHWDPIEGYMEKWEHS